VVSKLNLNHGNTAIYVADSSTHYQKHMTKKQSLSPKKWSAFLGCKTPTSPQLKMKISLRTLIACSYLHLTLEIHTGLVIQLSISAIQDLILVTSVLFSKGSKTHLTTTVISYKSSVKNTSLYSKRATGLYTNSKMCERRSTYTPNKRYYSQL